VSVRVYVADDHTMFREGLIAILKSREGMEVVGQSDTGEEAVAVIARTRPDVVITQLEMRLETATEILSKIRAASPNSRIVVLSVLDNLRYLRALSKLSIDAYLHKSSSAEELVATVEALGREPGGPNAVVSMPRDLLRRLGDGSPGGLSERETEVLILAARGLPNRRIAEELQLSEATIKRHLANVYEKAGVSSRTEAVRTAVMEQWIGLQEITSAAGNADGLTG
jgi:DNA-binding NarL/FixJ family response regulator